MAKSAGATTLPPQIGPRALSREQAAEYVGIGATKFDALVADGRMPPPKRIDGRAVWDIRQLDRAFDRLPGGAADERSGDPIDRLR